MGIAKTAVAFVSSARAKANVAMPGCRRCRRSAPRDRPSAALVLSWKIQATASTFAGCSANRTPPINAAGFGKPERISSATSRVQFTAWTQTFTT